MTETINDAHYEVEFTAWAHGRADREKPWKVVAVNTPGTPGRPSDGRTYMTSHATRQAAIKDAANHNARKSKRYKAIVEKANAILADELTIEIAKLERTTRIDDGSRPPL